MYNSENKIKRCLESIVNQTYNQFEVLIINDGSTDNSKQIIEDMNLDSRFIIINKENSGVSNARNLGIKKAKGKYLTFIDSDDYIEANHFETIINKMDLTKCDVLVNTYKMLTINGINHLSIDNLDITKRYCIENAISILKKNNLLNQSWNKTFVRSKILKLYNENLSIGEDIIFFLENIKSNSFISIVDSNSYIYDMTSETSLTKNYKLYFDTFECVTNKLYNETKRLIPNNSSIILEYCINDLLYYLYSIFIHDRNIGKKRYQYLCKKTNTLAFLKTLKINSLKYKIYIKLISSKSYFILSIFFHFLTLLK